MANVDIDVGGKTLNVDIDGLESMSPDQQQATVMQVSQHMMAPQAAPQAAPGDTSFSGALGYGLHGAAEGLGATAKLIGKETGWSGLSDAGSAIQGFAGAPKNYQPTNIGQDIHDGNYGTAFSKLPRAAAEAAVPMAATLGAGVAGAAAAPGLGAVAGVGAATAALNAGDNVAARQAANGEDPNALPSANDLIGAGLTTGAQVAGNLVGLGKVPGIAGGLAKLPLVARIPASAALEGVGAGVTNLATQVGDTADTAKGLTVDPYQAVGAGLQGAAARVGSMAPGAARGGVKAASDEVMSRLAPQPASLADAAAISQTNDLYNDAMAQAVATKGDTSPQAVMNSVKGQVKVEMVTTVNGLQKAGLMDSDQARSAKEVILNEALRHNNTIRSGVAGGTSTLFDALGDIQGMPEEASKALQNGAMVLDNLSGQSFEKNGNGPFRQIGSLLGQAGGVGTALSTGDPLTIAGAFAGQHLTGKLGSALGGGVDSLMGTNTPPAVLQAARANTMLKKAGLDNGGNPLQNLRDVNGALQDIQPQLAAQGQSSALAASNKQASADYAAASERDQGTLDTQAAQTEATRQAQIAQIQKTSQAQNAVQAANLAASAAAQEKANGQIQASRDGTLDAYLSGGLQDPSEASSSVGRQTAQEIAENNQRLRNQAQQLKLAQAQMAVLQKSQDRSIGGLAQAKMDASSRANAVSLLAPQQTPTPRSDVPEAAMAAAFQQAKLKAAGVQQQATAGSPALDTAMVGNPPDPVPVNTPLGADGTPLQGPPSRGAPTPHPAPTLAVAGPADPGNAIPAQPSAIPAQKAPWMNYVSGTHSAAEIHQGLDAAMVDGLYSPQEAAQLHTHTGTADGNFLRPLQAYLGATPPVRPQAASSQMPSGYRGPIFDPAKYQAATSQYQAHAASKLQLAAGDPVLQAAVINVRDEPSAAKKQAMATQILATLHGERLALAKELLTGPLLQSKVP